VRLSITQAEEEVSDKSLFQQMAEKDKSTIKEAILGKFKGLPS